MTVDNDIKKLTENVSSLQRDMAQVGTLVDRLDITIEKLTEVSTTVSQLLAVQGNRLEFQEKLAEKLEQLVETRRIETDKSIREVYSRIERVEEDLHEDMEKTQNKLIEKIDELKNEGAKQHEELHDRMSKLEKWLWTLIGGGMVVGFILNNIKLDNLF